MIINKNHKKTKYISTEDNENNQTVRFYFIKQTILWVIYQPSYQNLHMIFIWRVFLVKICRQNHKENFVLVCPSKVSTTGNNKYK